MVWIERRTCDRERSFIETEKAWISEQEKALILEQLRLEKNSGRKPDLTTPFSITPHLRDVVYLAIQYYQSVLLAIPIPEGYHLV